MQCCSLLLPPPLFAVSRYLFRLASRVPWPGIQLTVCVMLTVWTLRLFGIHAETCRCLHLRGCRLACTRSAAASMVAAGSADILSSKPICLCSTRHLVATHSVLLDNTSHSQLVYSDSWLPQKPGPRCGDSLPTSYPRHILQTEPRSNQASVVRSMSSKHVAGRPSCSVRVQKEPKQILVKHTILLAWLEA